MNIHVLHNCRLCLTIISYYHLHSCSYFFWNTWYSIPMNSKKKKNYCEYFLNLTRYFIMCHDLHSSISQNVIMRESWMNLNHGYSNIVGDWINSMEINWLNQWNSNLQSICASLLLSSQYAFWQLSLFKRRNKTNYLISVFLPNGWQYQSNLKFISYLKYIEVYQVLWMNSTRLL